MGNPNQAQFPDMPVGKVALTDSAGNEYNTANPLPSSATITTGDIEIGAVEIKNSSDDTRATVGANGLYVDVRAIQTGTNSIGRVGHNITGIGHGSKTVTTAGTDVVLASTTACKKVTIEAYELNTGRIAVGGSGVDATQANGTGITLGAKDSVTLEIDDLADVYIDSTVNGEGVRFTYLT